MRWSTTGRARPNTGTGLPMDGSDDCVPRELYVSLRVLSRRPLTLRRQACMIELRDKASNELLGTIVDEELRFLVDELEEESQTDRDYYLDADTIDMLEADGAPLNLVSLLRRVLGSREGIDVRWVRV